MRRIHPPELPLALGRGGLLRVLYRLGRHAASGVLTLDGPAMRPEVIVLRRGAAVCADGDLGKRTLTARLARLVAEARLRAAFDGAVTAYPPGAVHQVALAGWVRDHLEAQLDGALAERVQRDLAGVRLVLRADLAPEPLDEADRRMLAALAQPRSLDEIWPLARAPRFRLLGFLHFLRAVGAAGAAVTGAAEPATQRGASARVDGKEGAGRSASPTEGAGASAARRVDARRLAAMRVLGVDDPGDPDAIKRAYRRLARAVHPDLQPGVEDAQRRRLEHQFAELTAAYEALV